MGDWPPSKSSQDSPNNESKSIQERVAMSLLLLEEKEMFKKVMLTENNDYNPEDPLENKFRLAQSQYLSASGQYASPIESIDYVENRFLMEKFEIKKNKFKSEGKNDEECLLFHGTNYINVDNILRENFRMDYAGKHGQAYGRGIYFSAKTKIPNKYMNNGKRTLLLCRVLLGKEFLGKEKDIPEGFDSKSVKSDHDHWACINIIKDVDQILPCFVLNLAPLTGAPINFDEAKKRLLNDLKRIQSDPPEGVTCAPKGDNIMVWNAVIFGPDDSVFQDGIFHLTLTFNGQYPYVPPVVKFLSEMFHPNIDGDTGMIIVRHLRMLPASMERKKPPLTFINKQIFVDNWSPACGVLDILMALRILLVEPNMSGPYVINSQAAQLFRGFPQKYKKKVQESVEKSWTT